MSDGVCKKTKKQYIDEIVALIEEKAGNHGVDKNELLELINERCNTKWNKIEKKKSDIPIPTACALIYNINWSVRQYQELRLALVTTLYLLVVYI